MKLMIFAGEVSGDLYGSYLAAELRKKDPAAELSGTGGEMMAAAGVDIRAFTAHKGSVGFIESARHYGYFKKLLEETSAYAKAMPPDAFLFIDNQGFNIALAKKLKGLGLKALGVPFIYFFPPQVWIWSPPGEAKKVAKLFDHIITPFRREAEEYGKFTRNVQYTGHPIVDILSRTAEGEKKPAAGNGKRCIGLFPGSRDQELEALLPVMLEAKGELEKLYPGRYDYAVSVSSALFSGRIEELVGRSPFGKNVRIVLKNSHNLMKTCDMIFASSGTVTLEAALLGVPAVIMYRVSRSTYFIGRMLMKQKYIGLPNIILGREVFPEFIQGRMTVKNITGGAVGLLSPLFRPVMADARKKLGEYLEGKDSLEKTAGIIYNIIHNSHNERKKPN